MVNIPFFDKFPADIMVLQKRGSGGLLSFRDKARFRRKGLEEFYELKKRKKRFKPPSYNYMIPQTNGRPFILLYEYARDMFVPVDPYHLEEIPERDKNGDVVMEDYMGEGGIARIRPKIVQVVHLKAADEDMSQWAGVARRQAEEKYRKKSFMDKYWPFILLSFMFVAIIVLSWIFMQSISDTGMRVSDALNAAFNKISPGVAPPPG